MILATLRNFWMAIHEDMLSVKVGERLINRETLLSTLEEFFSENPDDNSKRITDYNPLPYLQLVLNAEQGEKNHNIYRLGAEGNNKCILYLQKKKTANDRILFMRSPRMLVKADTKRNRRGFYGVFVCTGGEWDSWLRLIENPAHNEWDKANYDGDKQTKEKISDFLRTIFSFVREKVDELFTTANSSEDTIKDLEQYLYIPTDVDEEDDDFVNESVTSNPTWELKEDGTSMTSDSEQVNPPKLPTDKQQIGVVLQPKMDTVKPNLNGEQLSGNGGSHGGSGGGRGNRYINRRNVFSKDIDAEKTNTLLRVPVKYRSFAKIVDGTVIHKLIIHSDTDIENGRIDLSVGTEDSTEQIIVVYSNCGVARDNTITNLTITADHPNEVEIRFADNLKHSVILEAYEVK